MVLFPDVLWLHFFLTLWKMVNRGFCHTSQSLALYPCIDISPANVKGDDLAMDLSQTSSFQSTNTNFLAIHNFHSHGFLLDSWCQAVAHSSRLQTSTFMASLFSTLNHTTLNCPSHITQIRCQDFLCWHLL